HGLLNDVVPCMAGTSYDGSTTAFSRISTATQSSFRSVFNPPVVPPYQLPGLSPYTLPGSPRTMDPSQNISWRGGHTRVLFPSIQIKLTEFGPDPNVTSYWDSQMDKHVLPAIGDVYRHFGAHSDFNNDARSDIVWQNVSTGQVVYWLMYGTMFQSGTAVSTLP